MTANHWEPTDRERELLFAELGLCVHLYQSIELRLKFLLPHLVVPGTDSHAPGEGFENWRILLDSKKTLGLLVQLLAERVSSDKTSALEETWRRLVEQRNDVVHHFASQPFIRLESEAEYREAVSFLKTRREFALPMFEMLQESSTAFFTAVREEVMRPDESIDSDAASAGIALLRSDGPLKH